MVSYSKMENEAVEEDGPTPEEVVASREERKRTGRYVAAGAAIFLSLLGIYQALLNGTPQYAAIFAPAVIMFIYLLWILHSSRNQTARLRKLREAQEKAEEAPIPLTVTTDIPDDNKNEDKIDNLSIEVKNENSDLAKEEQVESEKNYYFNRSYSIA